MKNDETENFLNDLHMIKPKKIADGEIGWLGMSILTGYLMPNPSPHKYVKYI